MKCPECGEEMEEGYVFLIIGLENAWAMLDWSIAEPPDFWSFLKVPKGTIVLLKKGTESRDKKHWLRKGFRCPTCEMFSFSCKKEKEFIEEKPKTPEELYAELLAVYTSPHRLLYEDGKSVLESKR